MQIPVLQSEWEKNDIKKPLLLNIPLDAPPFKDLAEPCLSGAGNFRVEFEASPFRTKIGRAQKAFSKLASAELMTKIDETVFKKVIPRESTKVDVKVEVEGADQAAALLDMSYYGLAKNLVSCVPEKGHLPTMSFTLSGSTSLILFPIVEVLSFFAQNNPDGKLKLNDAVQQLTQLSAEKFAELIVYLKAQSQEIFRGTSGAGDVVYTPPGWAAVLSTGNQDVIGLKSRCVIPGLIDNMSALDAKLVEHDSASVVLSSVLQSLRAA